MTAAAAGRKLPRSLVLFHDGKGFGGAEVHLLRLLEHLDRARFEPHVVIAQRLWREAAPEFVEGLEKSGVPLHVLRDDVRGGVAGRLLENLVLLRSLKAKLAYVGTSTAIGLRRDLLALRLAGMRIVRLLHMPAATMKTFHHERWSRFEVRQLDRLVALNLTVSDSDRRGLVDEFGIPASRIEVCYHGLELDRFAPGRVASEARRELGLAPDVPTVGAIGRFSKEKGQRYLIEAAPKILERFGRTRFVLVGDGPERAELTQLIEQLGLREHFVLPGHQRDVRPWIEALDLVVMPSLFESAGLVLLECMAMGRPVVVSDLPSIRDHVSEEACVLVPSRDPQAIARAVIELLGDEARRKVLADRGATLVRERFDMRRHIGQLMATFDRVLEGG